MPGPPGTGPPRKGAPPGGGNEIPQGGLVSTSSYPHISGAAAMGAPTRMMRPSLPHVMGVPPVPGPQQMEPPLGGPLSREVAQPTAPPTVQMPNFGAGGVPGSRSHPGRTVLPVAPPGMLTSDRSSVVSRLPSGMGALMPPVSAPPQPQGVGVSSSSASALLLLLAKGHWEGTLGRLCRVIARFPQLLAQEW